MSLPSFRETIKNKLFTAKSAFWTLIISFFYFSFSVLILNYRFVIDSLLGDYHLIYKFKVVYELIIGSYSAFSGLDFYLLIITSLLVGINVLMIVRLIDELKESKGKLSFAVGGSTLVGVAVAGCSSCGFSVLSLMGLGGALSFIPFGGLGLHLTIITLLIISLVYSVRTFHYKIACKITS